MKKTKFIPGQSWIWYAPNTFDQYGEREIKAVTRSLKNGWFTAGRLTSEFEQKVSGIFGKKHGLFVNSGSSANLLALDSLNLPKDSEIITPACTFATTLNPILFYGLKPVFIDVEEGRYTADAKEIEKAVSKKTKAMIIPHLIGNFADMPTLKSIAGKKGIKIIEDSCDTLGGTINGKPTGYWSDMSTTSFYASHIITAGGGGGMMMTNDAESLKRAKVMRDWGRGISKHDENIKSRLATFKIDLKPYDSAFVFLYRGFNFKPVEMQAAFGLEHLKKLAAFAKIRKDNFNQMLGFFRRFEDHFILPRELPGSETNWLAFPLTIRKKSSIKRNSIVAFLESKKIQTRPLFSGNIVKHPGYKGMRYKQIGKLENSNHILGNSFLIGMHHGITAGMISYMKEIFSEYLKKI